MKIVSIGDIHGRAIWKRIISTNEDADKFVFIGDYVDTHDDIKPVEQAHNLLEILQFKKENPERVVILIGNHDYQYWPGSPDFGTYSGFQAGIAPEFTRIFEENKKLFQMCYVDPYDNVYSHAGFTETFVEQRIGTFSEKNVNDIWKYSPKSFRFSPFDRSGCGDSVLQSCIWVRPQSLYRDGISKMQVVGHTTVHQINKPKSDRQGFYLIDCLHNKQYLSCVGGEFVVNKL